MRSPRRIWAAADAFEYSFLKVARHDIRLRTEDVSFAKDGLSGYDLVVAKKPALVLLDLMLPKLDGYEVCRSIRANDRVGKVQIIMLTAKSEECDIVKGLDLGANDYITNPLTGIVV